jgi:hypothetical protein
MRMRSLTLLATLIVVPGALVAACTSGRPRTTVTPSLSVSPTPAPLPVSSAGTRVVNGCTVTVPAPVPASESWAPSLFGSGFSYGNATLWVGGLGTGGVIEVGPGQIEPDGSLRTKFGWWRGASGSLTITGRRLDGNAPPAKAEVPGGYGDSGFQASGVTFPTPGCWEVTGELAGSRLTFVTLVTRR